MNKVIFLDIDGVLNSDTWINTHQREISDGILVSAEKVSLLGTLIHKTDAKVVLHSGWRFWFDNDLKPIRKEALCLAEMLHNENINIHDVTPDFSTEEIRSTKRFSMVKAKEILAWLEMHTEVCNWIVIDDLDLHNDIVYRHQITTDKAIGLTHKDIEHAKLMLSE